MVEITKKIGYNDLRTDRKVEQNRDSEFKYEFQKEREE